MSAVGTDTRRARAQRLLAGDPSTREPGVELVDATEEELVLRLPVGEQDANGVGVCHGGVIYHLGDSCAGIAANCSGTGSWVTTTATVTYVAPGRPGDVLTARSRVRWDGGRSRLVDTEITGPRGTVALMQSQMLRLRTAEGEGQ
ncbi:PaaI family thioesterase [Georgenia sp. H159]|uniref:PaaI family thioesterase n=1 Tax=Georgenia sp. H159 TaxID=3076115 RepID=UPI002D779B38|nr:PaaI family thioesterase [Georgenia sp. H159]